LKLYFDVINYNDFFYAGYKDGSFLYYLPFK